MELTGWLNLFFGQLIYGYLYKSWRWKELISYLYYMICELPDFGKSI